MSDWILDRKVGDDYMGVWGTSLSENDIGNDVRAYFEAQLQSGKSGSAITQELVEQYRDALADPEDAPAFWLALADTQWDHGRLEKGVKDKALLYLEYREGPLNGLSRPSSSEKAETDRLSALKEKLLSPPPRPKRIRPQSLYICPWKNGDVFAYQLQCQATTAHHLNGKYLYFVKVESGRWHPGHIVPNVYFYQAVTDRLLSLDDIEATAYMPQFFAPQAYTLNPARKHLYLLTLLSDTSVSVPSKRLTYIGNLKEVRRVENEDLSPYPVKWADFEEYIITNIQNWLHT